MNLTDNFKASISALLAFALFAIGDGMGKWLQDEGFDRYIILTLTQIPGLIILLTYMLYRFGWAQTFKKSLVKWHLARAFCIVSLTFFLFLAVRDLPLTDLYGIIFCAPFITAIGAYLFFGEHQTKREWIVILIGFTGILFIAQTDFSNFNIGYLYAFLQAVSISGASILVRKIGRAEHPFVFVIYANISVILFNFIPALMQPFPNFEIIHYLIFGIYSAILPLAILFLTTAFTIAPRMTAVLPYQYTQIVWVTVIGYIVFNNIPSWNVVTGASIIMAAGLYLIYSQVQTNKNKE